MKVKRKEETNLIYCPSWLHWVSKCHNLNRPQWSELIAHSSNSGFIGWFPYNASAEYLIVSGIWHKDFSPLLIQIWFRKPPSQVFFFLFFLLWGSKWIMSLYLNGPHVENKMQGSKRSHLEFNSFKFLISLFLGESKFSCNIPAMIMKLQLQATKEYLMCFIRKTRIYFSFDLLLRKSERQRYHTLAKKTPISLIEF